MKLSWIVLFASENNESKTIRIGSVIPTSEPEISEFLNQTFTKIDDAMKENLSSKAKISFGNDLPEYQVMLDLSKSEDDDSRKRMIKAALLSVINFAKKTTSDQ